MQCHICDKQQAITTIGRSLGLCESCAIDTALSLLAVTRLSDNAVQALMNAGYNLAALPVTQQHWRATDIAKELGVSAQKVGRIANQHGLKKAPYGEWRLDQAAYSHKQIESFVYNSKGRQALHELFRTNHDRTINPSIGVGGPNVRQERALQSDSQSLGCTGIHTTRPQENCPPLVCRT